MNDSISSRIGRIITGTAYSIVSKIEGLAPETVLEQAISEVDHVLDEVRAALGGITAQKHHVSKTMARLNHEHAELEEQVVVAYNQGRKDLVESALARQTDIEDQLPALEGQLGRLSKQESDHSQALTGLIAKRNEMEDELQEFIDSRKRDAAPVSDTDAEFARPDSALWKAERADGVFSRVIHRTTGINRSSLKSNSRESAKLVELANLSRNAKIEAKLKALEERIERESAHD
ncbi:PspA/IM30 family protein [Pelagicoccus sp. SDUM812005]|uniref:PspA/IM30 family protein n=1 Tax=Pelagicoccus sp. SDUM812005 TaxID=3041257 RepID=UPI00280FB6D7|nr:PspA/IM30 family protein [Pelagicoccus sp. SDUM812005]MDQ8181263.1 PspA/IM30 family protein [Pelagicoccus sp. SDUM812005]